MMLQPSHRWQGQRFQPGLLHIGVILFYTLLALFITWPVARNFTTGIVGRVGGVDAYQNAWNLWWVSHALVHGQLPFETTLLYYPNGVNLFWQTLGFSQGVLALPVTLLGGPLAAVNFILLVSFTLSGYVTFLFARHLTGSAAAGLVAGAVFAFSPFHMEKVLDGNLEVAAIQWVPCYVFAFYMLLERQTWPWALLSTGALLWVSLGSWYYGQFCLLYTGCAIIISILLRPPAHMVRRILWGGVPILIWGLVLARPLISLAHMGDDMLSDMRSMHIDRSADLLDFFWPSPVSPWWGSAVWSMRETLYPHGILWNVALGWIGWLLAGIGIVACWRHCWRWAALLVVTLVLAMGPVLQVAGYTTGIPLPFALLQDLPGIRAGQRPNHMVVLASLMLALLAAYGVVWLVEKLRLPLPQQGFLALALVGAIVFVDGYAGPLQIVERSVHPFYTTLPQPEGALLPLPLYYNINRSDNLLPQTVHTWPILGGYVARPPAYPFIDYTPGVRELVSGQAEPDDIVTPGWPESGRRALAAYAIQYVTMDLTSDKRAYFERVRARMQELGFAAPLVHDETLEAYALPASWPLRPLAFLGSGWQSLERDETYRWRWMGEQADIWLVNPLEHPVVTTIALTATSYQHERMLQLELDKVALGQRVVATGQPVIVDVQVLLHPGTHLLTLRAEATPDPLRETMPISVRVFGVDVQTQPVVPGRDD